MFKRIGQPAFFILVACAVALWQRSFVFALPAFFSQFNFVLIALIFVLFFFDLRWAIVFALAGGFWLDVSSFEFFGLYMIILTVTALLTDRLLRSWLTNRSLYSFVLLIMIATVVYNLLGSGFVYFISEEGGSFFLFRSAFWAGLGYQAAWSVVSALVMFNLAGAVTRRLQPFFLEEK